MYSVTNPATGELIEEIENATDAEVRAAIERVHSGYSSWRRRPVGERAAIVLRAAELFAERADELAAIMTLEMGKRINEGRGEIGIVVDIFTYYGEQGPALVADEPLSIKGGAAVIESVLRDAGVPDDVYVNTFASSRQIPSILQDPRIVGVSLTGSEQAGISVAAEAGRNLKRAVLELGGSDPLIVLDTDDLDETVNTTATARMRNCGQSCNAPKRMIVMGDLYDDFVDRLTKRVADYYQPGDPADPATKLPPLASVAAADEVAAQIETAIRQGATLRTGGHRIDGPGAYLEATVLTDVTPEMDAYREEIFGPVVLVFRADTEDEAVAIANDSPFGLGASVFGTDPARNRRVAEQIESGMVYLNSSGGSQADLPFGGIKRSGMGRELGPAGIEEFMNKKSIRL